ncbi:peptidase inhibitor family I36 protein [Silvibacterium acidisoli]|uniref:peptidase inhibitor family I36 protein n=1 Tax=Acidobacteriaceae bacterium ZG23-2 TaxID=2883246 RepID=UPI00406C1748
MKRLATFLAMIFAVTAVAQRPYPPPGPPPGQDPWAYGPQNNRWDPSWNRRPDPRAGACFYTTAPFRGNHFCVRAGDRLPALPGNFGDNISSIRVFGGARVRIFNDRNFRGGSTMVPGDVADLRQLPFRGGHTWNNRVSSISIR